MKVGILTNEKWEGRKYNSTGSSRIRGHWLLNYWKEAEEFVQGKRYDAVIYQKSYFVSHAELCPSFKIFDMCDPDWLHWGYQTKRMIEACDAVTTSTEALREVVEKFSGDKPVIHVPDRIDLNEHKERKVHIGDAKNVVWFGYSTAFVLLQTSISSLSKLNLGLIVVSDKPFSVSSNYKHKINIVNYPYNYKTVHKDIISGDIVINPKSSKGKWIYKSNNKDLTVWALGMPVAHNVKELKQFVSESSRKDEAKKRLEEIKNNWNVIKSVEQYKNIISQYSKIN